MAKIINTDIRFYKANDPYYWEVDNLPLRDLVENDRLLEEALTSSTGSGVSITKASYSELQPYFSGTDGKVYVKPGSFVARTSEDPTFSNGGTEEQGDRQLNGRETSYSTKNDSLNYPARLEAFRLLPEVDGTNPSVLIESWNANDFQGSGTAEARLDLVFLIASNVPTIGVIKGAGILTTTTGSRFTNDLGKIATSAIESDTTHASNSGKMGKLDFGLGTRVLGGYPLPEDLFNRADEIVGNAIIASSEEATFCIPLCYVFVPNGHVAGQTLEYLEDIRPLLRSAELTWEERQAIAVSEPKPSLVNYFVTKAISDALNTRVTTLENTPPNTTLDFDIFGKVKVFAGNNNVNLEAGSYIVYNTGTLQSSKGNNSEYDIKVIPKRSDGSRIPSLFGAYNDPDAGYIQHIGNHPDGTAPFACVFDMKLDSSAVVSINLTNVNGNRTYWIKIDN